MQKGVTTKKFVVYNGLWYTRLNHTKSLNNINVIKKKSKNR